MRNLSAFDRVIIQEAFDIKEVSNKSGAVANEVKDILGEGAENEDEASGSPKKAWSGWLPKQ